MRKCGQGAVYALKVLLAYAEGTSEMKLISADSHIVEPEVIWAPLKGLPGAPHVREVNGDHWWFSDEHQLTSFSGIQTGLRFEGQNRLRTSGNIAQVRAGGYQARPHLEDNERDSVFASVLYPTAGLNFYAIPDSRLFSDICSCYNDWLADFCSEDRNRLKGMAMLNVDRPDEAATELRRAKSLGLAGGLIPVYPGRGLSYSSQAFDSLWSVATELDTPLAMHIGTERSEFVHGPDRTALRGIRLPNADYWVRTALAEMIILQVFDRHPDLRIVSVEHELGWIPFFLERLDYHYTQKPKHERWRVLDLPLPSDYFRRNVKATLIEDKFVLAVHEVVGTEPLLWGSDYPHTESTFPRSQKIIDDTLRGVSTDAIRSITRDNAAELFHIDLSSLNRPGDASYSGDLRSMLGAKASDSSVH